MPDLKPCPFCGGEATIEPWHSPTKDSFMVSCTNDPPCNVLPRTVGQTWEQAVEHWNTRQETADG